MLPNCAVIGKQAHRFVQGRPRSLDVVEVLLDQTATDLQRPSAPATLERHVVPLKRGLDLMEEECVVAGPGRP